MWGMLANAGAGILRQVLPAAINWGMNKLNSTNLGKNFISPVLSTLLPMVSQHLPEPNTT